MRCLVGDTWNMADAEWWTRYGGPTTSLQSGVFVLLSALTDDTSIIQCGTRPVPPNIEQILEAHTRAIDNWEPE